jgi:hypothetical protein
VFSAPRESSKKVMVLKRDKVLTTDGTQKKGFYKLQTKSGKSLWIKKDDVLKRMLPRLK